MWSGITYSFRLARAMRAAGFSTRRLAAEAGVDRAGLRRIRTGRALPSWAVACRIAEVLKVPLSNLVGRKRHRVNKELSEDGSIKVEGGDDGEA